MLNGDEYENIELRRPDDVNLPDTGGGRLTSPCTDSGRDAQPDVDNNNHANELGSMEANRNLTNVALSSHQQSSLIGNDPDRMRDSSSGYGSESGDMLRDMVKNKELMKATARRKNLSKYSSVESDISEGSTLVSTTSDNPELFTGDPRRPTRIKHHAIRNVVSDSEMDVLSVPVRKCWIKQLCPCVAVSHSLVLNHCVSWLVRYSCFCVLYGGALYTLSII